MQLEDWIVTASNNPKDTGSEQHAAAASVPPQERN
jgi:hypothetical protein